MRELLWMAKGKLGAAWSQTAAVIRALSLTWAGTEPDLRIFMPEEFVPGGLGEIPMTEEEKEEEKKVREWKQQVDTQIKMQAYCQNVQPKGN